MNLAFLVFLSICVSIPNRNFFKPIPEKDAGVRAAIYSIPVDYSDAHRFIREEYGYFSIGEPQIVVSYRYFIQYGPDVVIDILDPGQGKEFMGTMINTWDYSKRQVSFTHYLNHVRKYRTTVDTIQFSIDECIGVVTALCSEPLPTSCDSLKFDHLSSNKSYTLYFKDRIPNIATYKLFYPDIEYLPYKIHGVGVQRNNTITLEDVLFGQPAIDSLIQLYTHTGYKEMKEEDFSHLDRQTIKELMEKFEKSRDK